MVGRGICPDDDNAMVQAHGHVPLKAHDKTCYPFFTNKILMKNQILDFGKFGDEVDMVVIIAVYDHIKQGRAN